ncbi:hypothetical protein NM208_g4361 [Fusarium decemcellulare]|uniref:Uncharacterized protein n=2 Tax=Fusarium decemcellulare TaxID=57161 RepID=A0ACC1SLA2_9HYPO|nr:hypothetical protein NM208_g11026 [Fusarium decemcellulare]KAJ3541939.1 hypothetical protein NM208_g4361 [Fusarium decemcellulare]
MADALTFIAFPIAAYQTVEKFYEFGKFTYELIQTYRDAPREIVEIESFMKNMCEGELNRNMMRTKWVFNSEDVPIFTKNTFSKLLLVLKEQLQVLQMSLEDCVDRQGNCKRFRYMGYYKRKIAASLAALEDWQLTFWRELNNLSTELILPDLLLLGKQFALPDHKCEAVSSTIRVGLSEVYENQKVERVFVLVEQVRKLKNDGLPEGKFASEIERKEVLDDTKLIAKELANTLRYSAKGILRCRGYIDSPAIELVFDLPDGCNAGHTLRQLLIKGRSGRNKDILAPWDFRLRLSRDLVIAVYSTNSAKYVHKNIRPDTVVVLSGATKHGAARTSAPTSGHGQEFPFSDLGSAYLMGWHKLRKQDAVTSYIVDEDWTKNFYRHPNRQGLHAQDRYETKHDVYSLGVCLLEIGLWQPFIIEKDGVPAVSDYFLSAANEHASDFAPGFQNADESKMGQLCGSGDLIAIFMRIASARLPMHMGTSFAELVVKCLTNIDGGFGDTDMFSGDKAAENFQQLVINETPIARLSTSN